MKVDVRNGVTQDGIPRRHLRRQSRTERPAIRQSHHAQTKIDEKESDSLRDNFAPPHKGINPRPIHPLQKLYRAGDPCPEVIQRLLRVLDARDVDAADAGDDNADLASAVLDLEGQRALVVDETGVEVGVGVQVVGGGVGGGDVEDVEEGVEAFGVGVEEKVTDLDGCHFGDCAWGRNGKGTAWVVRIEMITRGALQNACCLGLIYLTVVLFCVR